MSFVADFVSERELQLVKSLRSVKGVLREVLKPGSNGLLVALARERGLSLRQVTELVETAQHSIESIMNATHPEGWRGAWARFRWWWGWGSGRPLMKEREWRLAVALHDGARVVKALGLEAALGAETINLAAQCGWRH